MEFRVGKKVCSPIKGDASVFEITQGGAILMLKFQSPTSKEKNSIKSGVARFRAISIDGVVFFLARFGTNPWIDAPYNKTTSQSSIDRAANGMGLSLHIMLVDAATGILVAQRVIGLSTKFTNDLADLIDLQPNFADWDAYIAEINRIYAEYTTEDMVQLGGFEN